MSSSRKRGWSLRLRVRAGPGLVVPAHAGVVRCRPGGGRRVRGRLRAWGGPFSGSAAGSSRPHTCQGWPQRHVAEILGVAVVPALAGVVPRSVPSASAGSGRLRACGGGPTAGSGRMLSLSSCRVHWRSRRSTHARVDNDHVTRRPAAAPSNQVNQCSSKVQQPHRTRPTTSDRHGPIDLRQRPAATFLPLVHTEEVTGSIPVSPTQLTGRFPFRNRPFVIFGQQQIAATTTRAGHGAVGDHSQGHPEIVSDCFAETISGTIVERRRLLPTQRA